MIVKLNEAEMALTEQAGRLRWQLARASGVVDKVVDGDRDPMSIDRLGVRAELAVAKVLDLDFSASTLGIDSGGDLFIPVRDDQFITLQIKATFYKHGNLLFRHDCKFAFMFAVLVCQQDEPNAFEITGCIGRNRLNKKKFKANKGKGYTGWQINRQDLSPISDLWAYIQKRKFS